MSPYWILLAGLATVIGSILVLRLHAFLALVLGAFVVGLMTPPDVVFRYHLLSDQYAADVIPGTNRVRVRVEDAEKDLGGPFVAVGSEVTDFVKLNVVGDDGPGEALLEPVAPGTPRPLIVRMTDYATAKAAAETSIFGRLTAGLGSTCGKIGLLIAFASIIGYCLQSSGAAEQIVVSMLRVTGERAAPVGFMLSGFVLGIPVFFDTVFYLMIPLGQALHRKTGGSYLMYVLSIVAGATMAHSLVPPTPGPLFVAEELGVDMGVMMVGGTVVGLATLFVGYGWAILITRRNTLELPADSEAPLVSDRPRPSLLLSLLPIVIPVILIALPLTLKATGTSLGASTDGVFRTLGDRNVALAIAACSAIFLAVRYRDPGQGPLNESMEKALASAGIIILITSAGGAFGGMLRSSGLSLAGLVEDGASPLVLVTLAFVATTVIRTAQGSATVAMMTAVGVFGPIAAAGDLSFHPLYLALAIGAGSKPIAWMNDSGFWVITRMSGMTESQGLRYVTPMTALMGLAGLVLLLVGVTVFPNPF